MNVQNSQTDTEVDDVFAEEANNAIKETKVDEIEPSQNPSVIEELAKKKLGGQELNGKIQA